MGKLTTYGLQNEASVSRAFEGQEKLMKWEKSSWSWSITYSISTCSSAWKKYEHPISWYISEDPWLVLVFVYAVFIQVPMFPMCCINTDDLQAPLTFRTEDGQHLLGNSNRTRVLPENAPPQLWKTKFFKGNSSNIQVEPNDFQSKISVTLDVFGHNFSDLFFRT